MGKEGSPCNKRIKVEIGSTFGRLVVIKYEGYKEYPSGQKRKLWRCLCSCGQERIVESSKLTNRTRGTKSCGCIAREKASKRLKKHGRTGSREYKAWVDMKTRCYNPNFNGFKYYGGRGIRVCDRWLESFENFYEDMGDCPEGFELDRVDTNGDYCPENCRWADNSTQNFNKRWQETSKSGKVGVNYYAPSNKWAAKIGYRYKNIHLGYFNNFEDAVKARIEAEEKYYGKTS